MKRFMECLMKGKKTDSEFIADFISQSIMQGCDTPDLIVENAKKQIAVIDEQIKKVEAQKIVRSKLLDVITNFDKLGKSNKLEEAKILPFYKIQNLQICKFICDKLKNKSLHLKDIVSSHWSESDMIFCVKQMIECKIINKVGDSLVRAEKFEEYLKFVLKEG